MRASPRTILPALAALAVAAAACTSTPERDSTDDVPATPRTTAAIAAPTTTTTWTGPVTSLPSTTASTAIPAEAGDVAQLPTEAWEASRVRLAVTGDGALEAYVHLRSTTEEGGGNDAEVSAVMPLNGAGSVCGIDEGSVSATLEPTIHPESDAQRWRLLPAAATVVESDTDARSVRAEFVVVSGTASATMVLTADAVACDPAPAADDPDPALAAAATPGWLAANGAVVVDSTGLVWVPWAPFGPDADAQLVAERDRWDKTMPPLLDWAAANIAAAAPIAREKAAKPGSWHPVVDRSRLEIHYRERGSEVTEEIQVCPDRLGAYSPQTRQRRLEMLAPGGAMIHAVGETLNPMGSLLSFSPGEPMSIAGLRTLADQGFVPGDWSSEALDVVVRRAAVAAIIEETVPRAAMSMTPDSLWEACMDAATTASLSNRRSGSWGITLQALWSRGLRIEHETPPPEQVWVEMVQSGSRAGVIVCRPAETVHLLDASTGRRVGVLEERTEAARALWLAWTGDRFRAHRSASLEGRCEPGTSAWAAAVAQLGEWADESAATVDLARWWALGIRQPWMRVGQWVNVPQEVAWEAHRSVGLDLRLWCAIGPPIRDPFDAGEIRDIVAPHCTDSQRTRMLDQVAAAPPYTPAMSAFDLPAGTPWANRDEFPRRTTADILGCDPSESEIAADQRTRPIEPTLKRPWTPGLLAGSPSNGWPQPAAPCPGVEWPSFDDTRFWWPADTATGHGELRGN